jgi:hydrogenase maturation protease
MTDGPQNILLLGIGNVLWADEGFGVRAVEAFNERFDYPDQLTVMDGGTQGLALLPFIQDCDALIIVDAIDYDLEPGTMKIIEGDNVPAFMGAKKMSLHQTGFQEVLAAGFLMGWEPQRVVLIGVQPEVLDDYGGSLRPVVAKALDGALKAVVAELAALGVALTPRQTQVQKLGPNALARDAYEQDRPPEDKAYRYGDYRFVGRRLEDEAH